MEQTYVPTHEKWKAHFDYVKPYLMDERAIRIDGKSVFQIYRPHLVTRAADMLAYLEAVQKAVKSVNG